MSNLERASRMWNILVKCRRYLRKIINGQEQIISTWDVSISLPGLNNAAAAVGI